MSSRADPTPEKKTPFSGFGVMNKSHAKQDEKDKKESYQNGKYDTSVILNILCALQLFQSCHFSPASGFFEGNNLLSKVMLMSQKTSSSSRSASN